MALQRRRDGTLVYVTGSMGSGKTSWVRERTAGARRLLIWDGKGIDWGARERCAVLDRLSLLQRKALEPGPMRLSVRVPVTREHFAAFCSLAWAWSRREAGVLVVDEIADVTTPGKAPMQWGEIARKARAFGTDVYVTTQRPQECDKTAQGNAMLFHCGRQSDGEDQKYVARRLLGSADLLPRVAALGPLEWIERDARSGRIASGRVGISRRRTARA